MIPFALIVYCACALVCAVLVYGFTVSFFWHEIPELQQEASRRRVLIWRGIISGFLALVVPLNLITCFCLGMCKYGLMYRFPK
jgi:hypothetical protein